MHFSSSGSEVPDKLKFGKRWSTPRTTLIASTKPVNYSDQTWKLTGLINTDELMISPQMQSHRAALCSAYAHPPLQRCVPMESIMLHNIDPILSPELLYALRAMGHGDEIALVDANFPAESCGPSCIRADGSNNSEILTAVLSLMPLDSFVPDPAHCMQVVDDQDAVPDTVMDFQKIINETADAPKDIKSLERFAFYERAANVFAVVQTGERRLYGNIILKKGVIK